VTKDDANRVQRPSPDPRGPAPDPAAVGAVENQGRVEWVSEVSPPTRQETLSGFLAGACLMGIILFAAQSYSKPRSPEPKESFIGKTSVAFDPGLFDYGTVRQAEVVQHDFRLVNRSTNGARIVAMQASCSCTLVPEGLLGKVIKPSEKLLFPLTFNTGSRYGSQESWVEVALVSKGARYVARAILRGEIKEDFLIMPSAVDFGMLRPGQRASRSVILRPKAVTKLDVKVVEQAHGPFDVSVREQEGDGSTCRNCEVSITFQASKCTSRETISDTINLTTSSKRVPVVSIPVSARIAPDIEISPEVVVLPASGLSGESRFTLLTTQRSRVTQVAVKTAEGSNEIEVLGAEEGNLKKWAFSHSFRVANRALVAAQEIDVAVELQQGTDRTEARCVPVQLKRLTER